jgi:AcrR family transcriptional regulator
MSAYHHGDLAAALVRAGVTIVERDGIHALTLRAAARAVGVSHAAPARHFSDSTAFLAAVATAGFSHLGAQLAASAAVADPVDAFRESGRAYINFALEHPHWYRTTFHSSLADVSRFPDLRAASAAAFGHLTKAVERAMNAGAVRKADVSTLAITAWATVHGISILFIDGLLTNKVHATPDLQIIDEVLTSMYLGLRPPD